jgi:agmatinase
LDPAYAAGTGTPQFGGLTARELLTILEGVFELPVIGVEIVEVAPSLDPALTSLFAARKLVTEICGYVYEKKIIK